MDHNPFMEPPAIYMIYGVMAFCRSPGSETLATAIFFDKEDAAK